MSKTKQSNPVKFEAGPGLKVITEPDGTTSVYKTPSTVNDLPADQQVNLIESLLGKIKSNETAIMNMAEENDVIRQKIQKLVAFHSTPKTKVQQVMKALKK